MLATGWWAVLLASVMATATYAAQEQADAAGFEVRRGETHLVDGVYRLDARVDFRFSDETVEAMRNGVALTVVVEMQVLRIARLWDRKVAEVQARYRLQSHALSRQYVVKNLSTGASRTFRSLEEMTESLGTIDDFPLLDDHVLDPDESYRVRVRAKLEVESLPTPLRLGAYFKSAWRLTSDWKSWPLQR